jgi:lipoprotein-anchoring transpeptidase ErfK/SrfK
VNDTARHAPRLPGACRGAAGLVMGLTLCVPTVPAQASAPRAPASQALVVLLRDHVARTRPSVRAHRLETVAARRPLTRVRTILPVIQRSTSDDGRSWVHVRLPGRPLGHTGWIPTSFTREASTGWSLAVDLSARTVTVREQGRVTRRFRAVVGARGTPTPRGSFFIEEAVALAAQNGGPFALATSARSQVLQEFDGGPGQIALHGTHNLTGALGTAVSHGCVRLSPRAITWLARRIGQGTPLTITR